jgi:hypothetical protein
MTRVQAIIGADSLDEDIPELDIKWKRLGITRVDFNNSRFRTRAAKASESCIDPRKASEERERLGMTLTHDKIKMASIEFLTSDRLD